MRRSLAFIAAIFLALTLTFPSAAFAQDAFAPDYEQLLELYREMTELAHQYKQLYEEAEASNEILLAQIEQLNSQIKSLTATVERQQKLIEEQQKSLLNILGGDRIGIEAGVNVSGLSPITLEPYVAISLRF